MVQNSCWLSKSNKRSGLLPCWNPWLPSLSSVEAYFSFKPWVSSLISEVHTSNKASKRVALVCGSAGDRIRPFTVRKKWRAIASIWSRMVRTSPSVKSESDDFRKTDASGRVISRWFMASNLRRLQRTINWFVFVSSSKRLRKEFIYRVEKKKVKAGVLLYAVTMAAIFGSLLQFYLNRQVAHYQEYALNKERIGLLCYGQAEPKIRLIRKGGNRSFNLGQVSYQNRRKLAWWRRFVT